MRSQIEAVPAPSPRPFWSVMIPVYNRTAYLAQAIQSVLVQDPGVDSMQIEVVDDCSSSVDVGPIVREVGRGRVSLFRQPKNLGLSANWTSCIQRANGHVVHILHDDDTVRPGFYARVRERFEQAPTIGAVMCRHLFMDQDGHWKRLSPLERRTPGILEDWIGRIGLVQVLQCPAIAVKREVYEALGGFDPRLYFAVDWEMWKRIAVHYPVWFEPEPLACFREHADSHTKDLSERGANLLQDIRMAIEISRAYLPVERAHDLSRQAGETYAVFAMLNARDLVRQRQWRAAANLIREGFRCRCSIRVIGESIVFLGWVAVHQLWALLEACSSVSRGRRVNASRAGTASRAPEGPL